MHCLSAGTIFLCYCIVLLLQQAISNYSALRYFIAIFHNENTRDWFSLSHSHFEFMEKFRHVPVVKIIRQYILKCHIHLCFKFMNSNQVGLHSIQINTFNEEIKDIFTFFNYDFPMLSFFFKSCCHEGVFSTTVSSVYCHSNSLNLTLKYKIKHRTCREIVYCSTTTLNTRLA